MTLDQIRTAHFARPFRPFTLHFADGRSLEVRHPESWLTRTPAELFVVTAEDTLERVDVLLIVSLEEHGESSAA